MIINIKKVTQTLAENVANAKDLLGAAAEGRTGIETVAADIQEIERESEGLLGINAVMQNIANIMGAMEEQNQGTKQILDTMGTLDDIAQKVKDSSAEILEKSRQVSQKNKTLELVTGEIAGGMNEMAAGVDQINVAGQQVNEISGQNKDNLDVLVQEVSRFRVE
jgi:methyl-accepting chemotaxis protein